MNSTLVQILASIGSTFAFGLIFNLKGKKLLFASIGGGIGWGVYIYFKNLGNSDPGAFLFSSIAITIYSEIIARILKTPVTSTLIASLIPLVPGSGVYFTMYYFIQGLSNEATQKGIETLMITIAITVGILMVSAFSQIYYKIKRYKVIQNLKKIKSVKSKISTTNKKGLLQI